MTFGSSQVNLHEVRDVNISAGQLRAARGLLGWSQSDLAAASKVGRATIADFEAGKRDPYTRTLDELRAALEAAGVEFTNGGQPGVRLKATRIAIPEGVFLAGLKQLDPILRSNAQFDGFKLLYDGPTSVRLLRHGQVIGEASQHNGVAFFDPGVAHEGVQETKAKVEYIFEDWAGAALRRSNRSTD
jgi:transcriptional regulator with XRE-family HTH domain